MNQRDPKISVLIPTYNRAPFLFHTIKTCVGQKYENAEFVVMDDASEDHTEEVVTNFASSDCRIRYIKSDTNEGMRKNFEKGLSEIRGDYLICLGGDDALLPDALTELAEIIKQHPSEVVTWPTAGYEYRSTENARAKLIAPHEIFRPPYTVRLNTSEYLARQSKDLNYISDQKAPMLYVKSVVPISVVRNIQHLSAGVFFKSSTPDGYSSFAISSIVKTYVFTNRPFTMHGVSPNSAGLNYKRGKGDKEDLSHQFFSQNSDVPMAPELASAHYSPLITLMTADFLYQTDRLFGHGFSGVIKIRSIISKSLAELADASFSESRIPRELNILSTFASFAREMLFFEAEMKRVRRNSASTLIPDAVSDVWLYLDASRIGLANVNDAAEYMHLHRNSKRIYLKVRFLHAIANSARYKLQRMSKRIAIEHYMRKEHSG